MNSAPCMNCAERYLGCHGKCLSYNEWKASNKQPFKPYVSGQVYEQSRYYSSKYERRYTGRQV